MISVKNVTKKYGDKKVLDDVSFSIDGGSLVLLVGSSGAGKTTMIHALIGATDIDEGEIQVDNYKISKLKPVDIQEYRRKIGIVFQDYKLLPQKTVFENVSYALEVSGYERNFINSRTMDVLKLTGLEELRNHFPRQISGGEKQRTAIARALVHAPELLFADEPTGNLDYENTMALAKLFKKINESGTTIVLATHDRDVQDLLGKQTIRIENGKITNN